MNDFFDSLRILNLIWKRKFHFIIVGIIAVLLSAIFSGPTFIKLKFKSTARVYPVNLAVLSEESETEQMLEILNSKDIKFKIIEAFDLHEIYGIDKANPHFKTYMLDIYGKNVNASKTEFETVEINVMDNNPIVASNMCDSIIHFYNHKVREIHKAKDMEMIQILQKEIGNRNTELDSVVNQLLSLRKDFGILDYLKQVERVTEGYMTSLANGRGSSADSKKIQQLYDNLAEKGTDAVWLESRYLYLIENIEKLKTEYDAKKTEYEKDITYSHIIEHPFPADKKSYPVRWMIVAFSAISAVFLALLVFLVLDYRKPE